MSKTTEIKIAKCGGGLEAFDRTKLRRCLADAMKACGRDPRYAEALAKAVELHLAEWQETQPPTTDYIFRCLRTALEKTGMAGVAQYLISQRRQRAEQRRRLSVFDADQADCPTIPWRKSWVAETLRREHGVGHSVARILAGEIERRVLALDYDVVSRSLIVEIVRNELLAWGLAEGGPGMPGVEVATKPAREHAE